MQQLLKIKRPTSSPLSFSSSSSSPSSRATTATVAAPPPLLQVTPESGSSLTRDEARTGGPAGSSGNLRSSITSLQQLIIGGILLALAVLLVAKPSQATSNINSVWLSADPESLQVAPSSTISTNQTRQSALSTAASKSNGQPQQQSSFNGGQLILRSGEWFPATRAADYPLEAASSLQPSIMAPLDRQQQQQQQQQQRRQSNQDQPQHDHLAARFGTSSNASFTDEASSLDHRWSANQTNAQVQFDEEHQQHSAATRAGAHNQNRVPGPVSSGSDVDFEPTRASRRQDNETSTHSPQHSEAPSSMMFGSEPLGDFVSDSNNNKFGAYNNNSSQHSSAAGSSDADEYTAGNQSPPSSSYTGGEQTRLAAAAAFNGRRSASSQSRRAVSGASNQTVTVTNNSPQSYIYYLPDGDKWNPSVTTTNYHHATNELPVGDLAAPKWSSSSGGGGGNRRKLHDSGTQYDLSERDRMLATPRSTLAHASPSFVAGVVGNQLDLGSADEPAASNDADGGFSNQASHRGSSNGGSPPAESSPSQPMMSTAPHTIEHHHFGLANHHAAFEPVRTTTSIALASPTVVTGAQPAHSKEGPFGSGGRRSSSSDAYRTTPMPFYTATQPMPPVAGYHQLSSGSAHYNNRPFLPPAALQLAGSPQVLLGPRLVARPPRYSASASLSRRPSRQAAGLGLEPGAVGDWRRDFAAGGPPLVLRQRSNGNANHDQNHRSKQADSSNGKSLLRNYVPNIFGASRPKKSLLGSLGQRLTGTNQQQQQQISPLSIDVGQTIEGAFYDSLNDQPPRATAGNRRPPSWSSANYYQLLEQPPSFVSAYAADVGGSSQGQDSLRSTFATTNLGTHIRPSQAYLYSASGLPNGYGLTSLHSGAGGATVIRQPTVAPVSVHRRRRYPQMSPSALDSHLTQSSNHHMSHLMAAQKANERARGQQQQQQASASFIPVVALSVTKTSPAPRAPLSNTDPHDSQLDDSQPASGEDQIGAEMFDELLTNSKQQQQQRVPARDRHQLAGEQEYGNMASGSSFGGRESSATNSLRQQMAAAATNGGGRAEHTTTVKSAVFGYLPHQADGPLMQALSLLPPQQQSKIVASGGGGGHAASPSSETAIFAAAQQQQLEHHQQQQDQGTGDMSLAEEPPSLALQIQANSLVQNDIAHPFFDAPASLSAAAHSQLHHLGQHSGVASFARPTLVRPIDVYPASQHQYHGFQLLEPDAMASSLQQQQQQQRQQQQHGHLMMNPLLAGVDTGSLRNAQFLAAAASDLSPHLMQPGALLFAASRPIQSGQSFKWPAGIQNHANRDQSSQTNAAADQSSDEEALESTGSGASQSLNTGRKRSSEFFASAGQLLLSALPLLLAPALGLMFASSPNPVARYYGGNPFGQSAGSGGQPSLSAQHAAAYNINGGQVLNASPGPQLFTPTPLGYSVMASIPSAPTTNRPASANTNKTASLSANRASTTAPISSGGGSGSSFTSTSTSTSTTTPAPATLRANSSSSGSRTTSPMPKKTLILTTLGPPPFADTSELIGHLSGAAYEDLDADDNVTTRAPSTRFADHIAEHTILLLAHDINGGANSGNLSGDNNHMDAAAAAADNDNSARETTMMLTTLNATTAGLRNHYDISYEGADFDAQFAGLRSRPTPSTQQQQQKRRQQPPKPPALPAISATNSSASSYNNNIGLSNYLDHRQRHHQHHHHNYDNAGPTLNYRQHQQQQQQRQPQPSRDKNRYQYAQVELDGLSPSAAAHAASSTPAPSTLYTIPVNSSNNKSTAGVEEEEQELGEETSTKLYPVSTWPSMRRRPQRTVSLVTSNGNKTLPDASEKYHSISVEQPAPVVQQQQHPQKQAGRQVRGSGRGNNYGATAAASDERHQPLATLLLDDSDRVGRAPGNTFSTQQQPSSGGAPAGIQQDFVLSSSSENFTTTTFSPSSSSPSSSPSAALAGRAKRDTVLALEEAGQPRSARTSTLATEADNGTNLNNNNNNNNSVASEASGAAAKKVKRVRVKRIRDSAPTYNLQQQAQKSGESASGGGGSSSRRPVVAAAATLNALESTNSVSSAAQTGSLVEQTTNNGVDGPGGYQEPMKGDATKRKSAHIITTMVAHMNDGDEDHDDMNNLDSAGDSGIDESEELGGGQSDRDFRPQSSSSAGGYGADNASSASADLKEQLMQRKMILDKLATSNSFAGGRRVAPGNPGGHRSGGGHRFGELDDADHSAELVLDDVGPGRSFLGAGGRGRFPPSPLPIEVTSTKIKLYANGSEPGDPRLSGKYGTNYGRKNGLVLTEDTKRALAKFGSLLVKDTLQIPPAQAGAAGWRHYGNEHHHQLNNMAAGHKRRRESSNELLSMDGPRQRAQRYPQQQQQQQYQHTQQHYPYRKQALEDRYESAYDAATENSVTVRTTPGPMLGGYPHRLSGDSSAVDESFRAQDGRSFYGGGSSIAAGLPTGRSQQGGGGSGASRGAMNRSADDSGGYANFADNPPGRRYQLYATNASGSGSWEQNELAGSNEFGVRAPAFVRERASLMENEPPSLESSVPYGGGGGDGSDDKSMSSLSGGYHNGHAYITPAPSDRYSAQPGDRLFKSAAGGADADQTGYSNSNNNNLYPSMNSRHGNNSHSGSPAGNEPTQLGPDSNSRFSSYSAHTSTSNHSDGWRPDSGGQQPYVSDGRYGGGAHYNAGYYSSPNRLPDIPPASYHSHSHHQQQQHHHHQPAGAGSYTGYPTDPTRNNNYASPAPTGGYHHYHQADPATLSENHSNATPYAPMYHNYKPAGAAASVSGGSGGGGGSYGGHQSQQMSYNHHDDYPIAPGAHLSAATGGSGPGQQPPPAPSPQQELAPKHYYSSESRYTGHSGHDDHYGPPAPPPPPRADYYPGPAKSYQRGHSPPPFSPVPQSSPPPHSSPPQSADPASPYSTSSASAAAAALLHQGGPLAAIGAGGHDRSDSRAVNEYLKRVQFSDSDRDKLMASYLTCDGLLNDNDHCLERLSCEFSDPQNIEKANKLDRAVSSILLGHILINSYIPNQFKQRLKSASMFGYTQSGKCSRFVCNKLAKSSSGGGNSKAR